MLSNVNKVHVGTLPYETKRLTQEISGGIGETGCLPSYVDFNDPKYGPLVQKYLKAASSAESRARMPAHRVADAGRGSTRLHARRRFP
jgi:4-hydroxybutyryl-CoA dehydratase/vinylacetyl-CoA-Delta-isomerase